MDSVPDRNPSPPPELLQHCQELLPDRVGDSVFSKHWLFQILISIVEAVDKEVLEDVTAMQTSEQSATSDIHELDSELEEDACALWDMSANADVAHFLHEFKIVDIFIEVIEKTKSPRLLEIGIGILANMASLDDLCQDMSKNELLIKSVIPLTGSSDAPTIVQVLRLLHTGVVNEKTCHIWLDALKADTSFMKNIKFILENSLNAEVIKGALQLLYYILDKEEELCIEWADRGYTKSVIDAGKQLLGLSEFEAVDELWLLLNLMCQHEENVSTLAEYFEDLHPVYHAYLMRFGDYEYSLLPPMERVAAMAASFTTLATLLKRENINRDIFCKDDTFSKYVKNLYNSVTEVLEKATIIDRVEMRSRSNGDDEMADAGTSVPNCEKELHSDSVQNAADYNGDSCFSTRGKLTHAVSLHENDFDSLFILKETMTELCCIIFPSLLSVKDDDDDG